MESDSTFKRKITNTLPSRRNIQCLLQLNSVKYKKNNLFFYFYVTFSFLFWFSGPKLYCLCSHYLLRSEHQKDKVWS